MIRPAQLSARIVGRSVVFDLPAEFAGFLGHFPGDPVLPGMCQVDLAVRAVRLLVQRPGLELREIRRSRFQRPVPPGAEFRIEIETTEAGALVVAHARFLTGELRSGHAIIVLGERA